MKEVRTDMRLEGLAESSPSLDTKESAEKRLEGGRGREKVRGGGSRTAGVAGLVARDRWVGTSMDSASMERCRVSSGSSMEGALRTVLVDSSEGLAAGWGTGRMPGNAGDMGDELRPLTRRDCAT